jgi:signal transduction histidine kinase
VAAKNFLKGKLVRFEPSARIQGLLGRELISSDYVAVAEAIRNAYDAGARIITLTLYPRAPQRLTILDNGSGMSSTEFEKVWMTPGYSEKLNSAKTNGRIQLGEKGIGRFAVDKLSQKLVVVTKKHSESDALRAEFDWRRFEDQTKKLKDIKIRIQRVKDEELIKQGQGTRLDLTLLRRVWSEEEWDGLRTELKKLLSPSGKAYGFILTANASSWESGVVRPDFDASGSYVYVFSINKSGQITWSLNRPSKIIDELRKEGHRVPQVLSDTETTSNSFGSVSGRFHFFEKPAQIRKQGYDSGIGIYRDGFRVEPYGRGNDDWLGVKSLRTKGQGHAPVSPSKLFGFIEISRYKNYKLKDLTNREGIQDVPEFKNFTKVIFERFGHFASFIAEDKKNMPLAATIAGQRRSGTGKTRAQAFGELADQLAHQLRQPMTHINTDISTLKKHINRRYSEDAQINLYSERIQRNVSRLNDNIQYLSDLATHLKAPVSKIDLFAMIKSLVVANEPNFQQQGVRLSFETELETAVVNFSKPALQFALDNYLVNALKATIETKKAADGQVTLILTKARGGNRLRVSVEDSGDGLPSSQEKILFHQPVKSKTGQGIGLYYSKFHIDSFGGIVGFDRLKDGMRFYVEIPETIET